VKPFREWRIGKRHLAALVLALSGVFVFLSGITSLAGPINYAE
jgi:hypothetical protein